MADNFHLIYNNSIFIKNYLIEIFSALGILIQRRLLREVPSPYNALVIASM